MNLHFACTGAHVEVGGHLDADGAKEKTVFVEDLTPYACPSRSVATESRSAPRMAVLEQCVDLRLKYDRRPRVESSACTPCNPCICVHHATRNECIDPLTL